jgi:hypothetical protein
MAYNEEGYISEYTTAYETVLARTMESLSEGKDTPLEKLFNLIDWSGDNTTAIEKLSMKKDAYMSILQQVTTDSQDVALKLVEQKFTFHNVIKEQENKVYLSSKQKDIVDNQLAMSNIDTAFKQSNAQIDYDSKATMKAQAEADIAFNTSKKTIMEQTRLDNIRMKSAEQYAEFLKYISAANVVPAKEHFDNLISLINGVNDGITDPDHKPIINVVSGNQVTSIKDLQSTDTAEG